MPPGGEAVGEGPVAAMDRDCVPRVEQHEGDSEGARHNPRPAPDSRADDELQREGDQQAQGHDDEVLRTIDVYNLSLNMGSGQRDDETFTLREAAERLGVHYMTAYHYVRTGRIPARQRGRMWEVRRADVDALLVDNDQGAELAQRTR